MSQTQVCFTHTVDEQVVAQLQLMPGVDEAEVLHIETQSAFRRRGLAKRLMEQALSWCKQNQRQALWLEVRVGNLGARALYQGLGFVPVRVRAHYYADGEDALVMKCSL